MGRLALWLLGCVACAAACASVPDTHYYRLSTPTLAAADQAIAGILMIESFEADAVYSDDRIVYRASPYRLDYYNYHRWTSPPAVHLRDYLRDAFARSGLFRRVTTTSLPEPDAVLSGRVTTFDEIDESETSWVGRLTLELTLSDPRTSAILWAQRFDESEHIPQRTPEGVAIALSRAMRRVVQASAPAIAAAMQERVAPPPATLSSPEAPPDHSGSEQ
jgi:ABC-type uncharacterized transport system auxiliary subunit